MTTHLLIISLMLGAPMLATAQVTDLSRDKAGNLNGGYALADASSRELKGSPFLLPYWAPAMLQLAPAGSAPIATMLKYDVYRQELRVRRPQGDSIIVPLAKVQEFSLTSANGTRRFVRHPAAALPPELVGTCAEVLYEGPHAQVLKFWQKKLVKQAGESNGYASASQVTVLEEQTQYFLRWPADGRLTPLRLRRASLEQALAGQPAALAALKTRKGSLNTEPEVTAAMAALDPLLTGPATR